MATVKEAPRVTERTKQSVCQALLSLVGEMEALVLYRHEYPDEFSWPGSGSQIPTEFPKVLEELREAVDGFEVAWEEGTPGRARIGFTILKGRTWMGCFLVGHSPRFDFRTSCPGLPVFPEKQWRTSAAAGASR